MPPRPDEQPTLVTAVAPGGGPPDLIDQGATKPSAHEFSVAAAAAVVHLSQQAPGTTWALTSVDGVHQRVEACGGARADRLPVGAQLPWLGSFALHLAAGRAPTCAPRVREIALYAAAASGAWAWVEAYVGVPLTYGEDQLYGVLNGFADHRSAAPLVEVADTAQLLGTLLSALLTARNELVRVEELLGDAQHRARTDALTGLRNSRGWLDELARESRRSERYGTPAAVVVVDLDHFKAVNDVHGHAAGDDVLRQVAHHLTHACRPSDVVARPGGDEFAVLALSADDGTVGALTTRIRDSLTAVGIAASVAGVVQEAAEELHKTWSRADAAMFEEKRRRNGRRGGRWPAGGPDRGRR